MVTLSSRVFRASRSRTGTWRVSVVRWGQNKIGSAMHPSRARERIWPVGFGWRGRQHRIVLATGLYKCKWLRACMQALLWASSAAAAPGPIESCGRDATASRAPSRRDSRSFCFPRIHIHWFRTAADSSQPFMIRMDRIGYGWNRIWMSFFIIF